MKSTWTERYVISYEDLRTDLQRRHPDWDEAQVAGEALRWAAAQDLLDHEDYKKDRNFYGRQRPCEDPHQLDREPDADPGASA